MTDELPAGLLAKFAPGAQIAGYRLEERIGSGGMAVVFRALDTRLQRQVALKILAPGLADDDAFRQRFIRESRAAATVDDPHIVPVFEAGEADGLLYIAMRYVPGGDALTLLDQVGPLPAARAAGIVSAAASALDAAHAAGLVHRDVKPGNMLVDSRPGRPDHVYLSDFGLARGELASVAMTGTGQFLGTLDYCAPEQIQGGRIDGRTDQYALACAAFELLAGAPPFHRDDAMAVLYAQLSEPPPLLSAKRQGLPAGADAVLARAMAKAPQDRYASCCEFAEALRAALGLPGYDADPQITPPPGYPRTEAAAFWNPASQPPQWQATPAMPPGPVTQPGPAGPPGPYLPSAPAAGRAGRARVGIIVLASAALLAAGGAAAALVSSGSGNQGSPGASGSTHGTSGRSGQQSTPPGGSQTTPVGSTTPASNSQSSQTGLGSGSAQPVRALPDPGTGGQPVHSVAFSPDGRTLLTGDEDGNAYLWSVATGRVLAKLRGPAGADVLSVALSSDGALAAVGYYNGSTSIWNAVTGTYLDSIPAPRHGQVNWLAFSPRGNLLAVGQGNGSTYLWSVGAGGFPSAVATLRDPARKGIWAVAFSRDGSLLATTDYTGNAYVWQVGAPTQRPAGPYTVPGGLYGTAVAFSPNSQAIAVSNGSKDGKAGGATYVFPLNGGTPAMIVEPETVWGLAFVSNRTLAIADDDGSTYLWTLSTSQQVTLSDPAHGSQGVGAVAVSPDGGTLATGDTNGTTYLWNLG